MKDFPMDFEKAIATGSVDDISWVAYPAPLYGAVNGYVRLPDGHPWLGMENDWDIPSDIPWGEITYRFGNWIGFDSLHHGQVWPDSPHCYGETPNMTPEDVIEWTEQLAKQAHNAVKESE